MHYEDAGMGASPHDVVTLIRDAHEFYSENRIDERYEFMALDLIRRYALQVGLPRETDSLFGATLYIVSRHAWSFPNPLTKTEFATKLRMKESSLDWYTESVVEKLGFATLHDRNHLPFFIDPQGTIASVIDSVVGGNVGEEVVRSIVMGNVLSAEKLTERIVDQLCRVVKIVPTAFEQELHSLVQRRIEKVSARILSELDGSPSKR